MTPRHSRSIISAIRRSSAEQTRDAILKIAPLAVHEGWCSILTDRAIVSPGFGTSLGQWRVRISPYSRLSSSGGTSHRLAAGNRRSTPVTQTHLPNIRVHRRFQTSAYLADAGDAFLRTA